MTLADRPPALDPVTQLFVDWLAAQPAQSQTVLTSAQSSPVGKPRVDIDDVVFPVGPSGSVEVRIIRPRTAPQALPVVMAFHGGGVFLGDRQTHDRLMREIAVGAHAAVLFVDYARAPDSRFPIAIEQAYAATRYVASEAARLNLDANRLAVLGDGFGGTLATTVALLARERRGPKIDLQILLYPVTDIRLDTASYRRFAEGPWLTRTTMQQFWDVYLPQSDRGQGDPAVPLEITIDRLRDLPEALVLLAENDVLHDEGEAYARKLADAGVRVTSVRYNGTIHDFLLFDALADTPAVRSAILQIVTALKTTFD
jgi:acetyl esterase